MHKYILGFIGLFKKTCTTIQKFEISEIFFLICKSLLIKNTVKE